MKTWFKGIKGRLLMSGIIPILTFAFSTYIASKNMSALGNMLNEAYMTIAPNLTSLGKINEGRGSMSDGFHRALLFPDNKTLREEAINYAEENLKHIKSYIENFESSSNIEGGDELYSKVKGIKESYLKTSEEILVLLQKNDAESDKKAKDLLTGKWAEDSKAIDGSMDALQALYDEAATMRLVEQDEKRTHAMNLLILVGLVSVFAVLGSLAWTAFSVTRSVEKIADSLESSGNQVADAISDLSQTGQNLSHSSSAAAASLEETVASLEEMTSMVQMNSDNAKQAAALSHSSREAAERGEREIRELVSSMQDIAQSSKKIEEIIHVIDDIAFQTNLLALNASVEAARAGEHGKGFAVVADAVRTLAQRSATAAKDINSLIKDSVGKIDRGTDIADKSGIVMNDIVTAVKKVSDLANEIAAASSEQTVGIQQVSKAMNQLDQGAQTNAASSEKVAATAEEVSGQAHQMKEYVQQLHIVVSGFYDPNHISDLHESKISNSKKADVKKATTSFISKFNLFKGTQKSSPELSTIHSETKTTLAQNTSSSAKPKLAVVSKSKSAQMDSSPIKTKAKTPTQSTPVAAKQSSVAKVSKASPSASKKVASSDIIPFDDDDRGGIGDTSGF